MVGDEEGRSASEGGLRREPELPELEEVAPEASEYREFDLVDDADGDEEALKARELARQRLQQFTRAAAMDRDDGMLPEL